MIRQRPDLDTKYLGTPFDRQVRIESWDQNVLSQQTALCLGAGGLGSVVVMNLLRLGLKKLIIVDYDVVDIHNLNRQFMYTLSNVGKSKVSSIIQNSKFHNVGNTELVGFQGCVLSNWQRIIEFAKQSDVVFNMIDYGDWFDAAAQSLCFALNKPLIQGGTFALSLTVDFFSTKGKPCYVCLTDQILRNKEMLERIEKDKILSYESLKFLPKNNNPIGRSSVCVCTICGEFMISHYLNNLFFSEQGYKTQRLIFYLNAFESVNFPLEAEKSCNLCGDKHYKQPAKIVQTKDTDEIKSDLEKTNEVIVQSQQLQNIKQPIGQAKIQQKQQVQLKEQNILTESNSK